jgi:hypothetical protein
MIRTSGGPVNLSGMTQMQIEEIGHEHQNSLNYICAHRLLPPPASKRLVKLHKRQTLIQLGLHQVEFG